MTTNLDHLRSFIHAQMPERLADFDGFLLRYKGLHHDDDVLLLIEAMGWTACISERIPNELKELVIRAEAVAEVLTRATVKTESAAAAVNDGMEQFEKRAAGAISEIDTSELAKRFMHGVADVLSRTEKANELLIKNADAALKADKLLTQTFVIYILLAGIIVGLLAGWQLPRFMAQLNY